MKTKRIMLNANEETQAYLNQIKKMLNKKGLEPSDSQVISYALTVAFLKLYQNGQINDDK